MNTIELTHRMIDDPMNTAIQLETSSTLADLINQIELCQPYYIYYK